MGGFPKWPRRDAIQLRAQMGEPKGAGETPPRLPAFAKASVRHAGKMPALQKTVRANPRNLRPIESSR